MSVSITVQSTLTATDSVSSLLNKTIATTSTCTMVDYSTSFNVTTAPASLILPLSPLQVVYVKNVGSVNVQVTWTPTGGGSAIVQSLTPTSFILFIQNTVGQGVSAVSVVTLSGSSKIEYVIGG